MIKSLAMTEFLSEAGKWLSAVVPYLSSPETKETIIREIKEVVMPPQGKLFVKVAGLSGALAVALAAYGSHVLKPKADGGEEYEHRQIVFRNAQTIHMLHTCALFCTPLARYPYLSGGLFTIGSALFCGGTYYIALTGDKRFSKMNPIGGSTLIIAWLTVML